MKMLTFYFLLKRVRLMETIKKVARSFLKMVTLETFYKISWPFCSGCLMWQVNIAGNLSTSYSEMDLRISGLSHTDDVLSRVRGATTDWRLWLWLRWEAGSLSPTLGFTLTLSAHWLTSLSTLSAATIKTLRAWDNETEINCVFLTQFTRYFRQILTILARNQFYSVSVRRVRHAHLLIKSRHNKEKGERGMDRGKSWNVAFEGRKQKRERTDKGSKNVNLNTHQLHQGNTGDNL